MEQRSPFIVGDWIKRDEDFIGRQGLIEKYCRLNRANYWLIGARRMGKTSLLRHLQRQLRKRRDVLPLYWDVSGTDRSSDLKDSLQDALDGCAGDFEQKGLSVDMSSFENSNTVDILRLITKTISAANLKLVILIDESEALLRLAATERNFIERLKSVLTNNLNLHVIIASNHGTLPYDGLDMTFHAASFLQPFVPPDYLTTWSDAEAKQLLARMDLAPDEIETIVRETGALPFLVQLVGSCVYELGDVGRAIEHINNDNVLDLFFRDDFNYFRREDIELLDQVRQHEPISVSEVTRIRNAAAKKIKKHLVCLEHLGFLARKSTNLYRISNRFLYQWMEENITPSTMDQRAARPGYSEKEAFSDSLIVSIDDREVGVAYRPQGNREAAWRNTYSLPTGFDEEADLFDLKSCKASGRKLYRAILEKPADELRRAFPDALHAATCLKFRIAGKQANSLPVEFLHDREDFLCKKYGFTRLVDSERPSADELALPDEGPLQILLIASNTPPDLAFADAEAIAIGKELQRLAHDLSLRANVEIQLTSEATAPRVQEKLEQRCWDILHFVGHYNTSLPGKPGMIYFWTEESQRGRVGAVDPAALFANVTAAPKFVFFNACQSASAKPAQAGSFDAGLLSVLFQQGCRCFLGNRFDVEDRTAGLFAKSFYTKLFYHQFSFARALQKTRAEWSERTRFQANGHLVWLPPVLFQ